jgi:Tfp pilus assembly protein PilF
MLALLVTVTMLGAPAKPQAPPAPSLEERRQAYYHYSLAFQARLSGDGETALGELRRAQKLDPRSADIRLATARLLRDLGKPAEAVVEARQAV